MSENLFKIRVFRRNLMKLIIVWERSQLDPAFVDPVIASIVDAEGKETLLTYSKFVPDNPEKFTRDIDGVVISQPRNKLDPNVGYKVKMAFSNGHIYQEATVDITPVCAQPPLDPATVATICHMYAYDYSQKTWRPLPVDPRLMVQLEEQP